MNEQFEIGIVGGGLAGLALSIQLASDGHAVILFEKEAYPFHRVCGEYISRESWEFLLGLGVDPPVRRIGQELVGCLLPCSGDPVPPTRRPGGRAGLRGHRAPAVVRPCIVGPTA